MHFWILKHLCIDSFLFIYLFIFLRWCSKYILMHFKILKTFMWTIFDRFFFIEFVFVFLWGYSKYSLIHFNFFFIYR